MKTKVSENTFERSERQRILIPIERDTPQADDLGAHLEMAEGAAFGYPSTLQF